MATILHEPAHYACPFCGIQRGQFDDHNQPTDVVGVTEDAFARIAPKRWPGNPGAVLVIPRRHTENLYSITPEENRAVWDLTRRVAIAIRDGYDCHGTSVRQHNEPAGEQDVWHLHVHVFPRYEGDALYERHREARWVAADERAAYAERLRARLRLPTSF
ncbi:HIT family protein [Microbacterium sp. JZ31]|uniref:HIT family protein n=1 Tax=Microbacterium sp. JZ31 TaxID=1906274 RepID=UPI001932B89F|nr:HIT family protein [Microbacterium sp. JZ31]